MLCYGSPKLRQLQQSASEDQRSGDRLAPVRMIDADGTSCLTQKCLLSSCLRPLEMARAILRAYGEGTQRGTDLFLNLEINLSLFSATGRQSLLGDPRLSVVAWRLEIAVQSLILRMPPSIDAQGCSPPSFNLWWQNADIPLRKR